MLTSERAGSVVPVAGSATNECDFVGIGSTNVIPPTCALVPCIREIARRQPDLTEASHEDSAIDLAPDDIVIRLDTPCILIEYCARIHHAITRTLRMFHTKIG